MPNILIVYRNGAGAETTVEAQEILGVRIAPVVTPPAPTPAPPPAPPPEASGAVRRLVSWETKECAGQRGSWPTTAVVPLKRGAVTDVHTLGLVDAAGRPVRAQFEVLNRWPRGGGLRHVAVHYSPFLSADSSAGHTLVMGAPNQWRWPGLWVNENPAWVSAGSITLMRAPFEVRVSSGPMHATLYDAGAPTELFARSDVTIEVEERGPVRAVLKASAPTTQDRFGWAVRFYVYVDTPDVKVDFQLQNSDMTRRFSEPRAFDSMALRFPAQQVQSEYRQFSRWPMTTNPEGQPLGTLLGTPSLVVRNFQQMGPSALEREFFEARAVLWAPIGTKHVLEDLQCTVRELLVIAPGATQAVLDGKARSFQLPPVPVLQPSWYASTEATLDLDGSFPLAAPAPAPTPPATERRRPNYDVYSNQISVSLGWAEKMRWDAFGADLARRAAPNATGRWPYSVSRFFLTGSPADYFYAQDFAMGELNVMPQWLVGYDHTRDFERVHPTENPYGGFSWRWFDGVFGYSPQPRPAGADARAPSKPRDDQHAWFYHIEEAFYMSGNLWIRDWYRSALEFRKTRLRQADPWPDMSARAIGHALSHALQAARVLSDEAALDQVALYVSTHVAPLFDPVLGGVRPRPGYEREAVFQLGYLGRALITFIHERGVFAPESVPAIELLLGMVRWNLAHGRFGYYVGLNEQNVTSDGSAMSFLDVVAWYLRGRPPVGNAPRAVWETSATIDFRTAVRAQLDAYCSTGLGGGERPYVGDSGPWTGDFIGRLAVALRAAP